MFDCDVLRAAESARAPGPVDRMSRVILTTLAAACIAALASCAPKHDAAAPASVEPRTVSVVRV